MLDVRPGEEGCCDSEWPGPGSTTDKKSIDKLFKDQKKLAIACAIGSTARAKPDRILSWRRTYQRDRATSLDCTSPVGKCL